MYDPMTVAHEIRRPWPKKSKHFTYWPPIVTIWHVDPERGGSDDSCGFSYYRPTKGDCEWAEAEARREFKGAFGEAYSAINLMAADDVSILLYGWSLVKRRRTKHWPDLSPEDVAEAHRLLCNPVDNLAGIIRRARESEDGLADLLTCLIRIYETKRRHWWQKPKWHVHHWRFQVHFLLDLKRWLFSSCASCGKPFSWGYCPVTGQWGGRGPRWFRGEEAVYHQGCYPTGGPSVKSSREPVEKMIVASPGAEIVH